jgi:hypothetical protein
MGHFQTESEPENETLALLLQIRHAAEPHLFGAEDKRAGVIGKWYIWSAAKLGGGNAPSGLQELSDSFGFTMN